MIGIGIAIPGQGAAHSTEWVPPALSGLLLWLRADLGITLGSTLKPTGTAPPVVTISGTPNGLYGLHIEIDSTAGGTGLGQATFKWSLNNGTTYQATGVATAASVVLGTSGITVAFAAGPYNVDNKYDATVSQWNDQSGGARNFAQGTASAQLQLATSSQNAQPAVRGLSASTRMTGSVPVGTQATFCAVVSKSSIASGYIFSATSGGDAPGFISNFAGVSFEWYDNADRYTLSAGAAGSHILTVTQVNGGALNGYLDGVSAFTQTASVALSTPIVNLMNASTAANGSGSDLSEFMIYNRALSTAELVRLHAYLKARYAL